MGSDPADPITHLLLRWNAGEADCLGQLIPLVESHLRRIAHRHMRNERAGHTLQTTALINEAYLKLVGIRWSGRPKVLSERDGPGFPGPGVALDGFIQRSTR